ncbi:MAG TPA: aspartyl protease family protein [Phycisphaerae bacterium]
MIRISLAGVVLAMASIAGCKEEPARPPSGGNSANKSAPSRASTIASDELAARLESAYREDKLTAGLAAAREVADAGTSDIRLLGLAARAFYRAGYLAEASQSISNVDTSKAEVPLLLIGARLSRAQANLPLTERSLEMARKVSADNPEVLNELVYLRMAQRRYSDAAQAAETLDRALASASGYPVETLKSVNAGRAEFLKQAGTKPLNVVQHGAGKMAWTTIQDFQRPYVVEAKINGHGPYQLAIDLVGGTYVSLPPKLAEEAEITPVANGTVLTLDGPRTAPWAVANSIELGTARIERAITRIFEEPAKLEYPPDGVIGIGVFAEQRATLNRAARTPAEWQFEVGASGPLEPDAPPDRGTEPLFYLADNRPTFITQVEGRRALATIGSYIAVSSESLALRLDLYPDTLPMGPPEKAGYPTPGVGSGLSEAHVGTSPSCLGRAWCVDAEFGGRGVPLSIALDAPFNEMYIDRLLGTHPDVFYGVDITERMAKLIIDGPQRKVQIQWIHVPEPPASQPASAPAASPAQVSAPAPPVPAQDQGFTPIDAQPPP